MTRLFCTFCRLHRTIKNYEGHEDARWRQRHSRSPRAAPKQYRKEQHEPGGEHSVVSKVTHCARSGALVQFALPAILDRQSSQARHDAAQWLPTTFQPAYCSYGSLCHTQHCPCGDSAVARTQLHYVRAAGLVVHRIVTPPLHCSTARQHQDVSWADPLPAQWCNHHVTQQDVLVDQCSSISRPSDSVPSRSHYALKCCAH
jgi:hypothetical protein